MGSVHKTSEPGRGGMKCTHWSWEARSPDIHWLLCLPATSLEPRGTAKTVRGGSGPKTSRRQERAVMQPGEKAPSSYTQTRACTRTPQTTKHTQAPSVLRFSLRFPLSPAQDFTMYTTEVRSSGFLQPPPKPRDTTCHHLRPFTEVQQALWGWRVLESQGTASPCFLQA